MSSEEWSTSKNGNACLHINGKVVTVYRTREGEFGLVGSCPGKDSVFSRKKWRTKSAAIAAVCRMFAVLGP